MCAGVDAYLESCVDSYEEWHKTHGEKSDTYERYLTVNLPLVEGLAGHLGVARSTIFKWAEEHPEFSDSLEKLKEQQKKTLIMGSLSGTYSPVIAKLMLSVNHDMVERKEIDHTSKGEKIDGFNYVAPDGDSND